MVMRVPKPTYELWGSKYHWVLSIPNREKALKDWAKRYTKLFELSISEEWWHSSWMQRLTVEAYERYAALRWPELMTVPRNEYENPDLCPNYMVILVNVKKAPGAYERLVKIYPALCREKFWTIHCK